MLVTFCRGALSVHVVAEIRTAAITSLSHSIMMGIVSTCTDEAWSQGVIAVSRQRPTTGAHRPAEKEPEHFGSSPTHAELPQQPTVQ